MGTLGGSFGASSLGDGGRDETGVVVYDAMMTFLVVEFNDITLWLCGGGVDWKAPSPSAPKAVHRISQLHARLPSSLTAAVSTLLHTLNRSASPFKPSVAVG